MNEIAGLDHIIGASSRHLGEVALAGEDLHHCRLHDRFSQPAAIPPRILSNTGSGALSRRGQVPHNKICLTVISIPARRKARFHVFGVHERARRRGASGAEAAKILVMKRKP
jgi:hypothetical protein